MSTDTLPESPRMLHDGFRSLTIPPHEEEVWNHEHERTDQLQEKFRVHIENDEEQYNRVNIKKANSKDGHESVLNYMSYTPASVENRHREKGFRSSITPVQTEGPNHHQIETMVKTYNKYKAHIETNQKQDNRVDIQKTKTKEKEEGVLNDLSTMAVSVENSYNHKRETTQQSKRSSEPESKKTGDTSASIHAEALASNDISLLGEKVALTTYQYTYFYIKVLLR